MLKPDLDEIPALSSERDALWSRLQATTFLTDDEKRLAIGYAPKSSAPAPEADKFNPFHDDRGRFTNNPNGADNVQLANSRGRGGAGLRPISPAQAQRLDNAGNNARADIARVQERDPTWKPTPQLTDPMSAEGQISAYEAMSAEAQARLAELLRGSIPGANPDWGVRRLENALRDRGFVFANPTRDPGKMFRNPQTEEEVRIMERPQTEPSRNESPQKRLNDFYYRYRTGPDQEWLPHTTIPNKR